MKTLIALPVFCALLVCEVGGQDAGGVPATPSVPTPCCDAIPDPGINFDPSTPGCTIDLCRNVERSALSGNVSYLETFLLCRRPHISAIVVPQVSKCIAAKLSSSDLVYSRSATTTDVERVHRTILYLGCRELAKTTACNTTLHLLTPAQYLTLATTPMELLVNTSITDFLLTCLAAPRGSLEWEGGMSSCAYSQDNTLVRDTSVSPTCQECIIGLRQTAPPFCSNHFTLGSTKKYGTRCSRADFADQAAQSLYSSWTSSSRATISSTVNITDTSAGCVSLLRHVACQVSLGSCQGNTAASAKPVQWCQAGCRTSFMNDCSLTATQATSVCQAVGATSTASTCAAIIPANEGEASNFTVTTTGGSLSQVNIRACQLLPESARVTVNLAWNALVASVCVSSGCVHSIVFDAATGVAACPAALFVYITLPSSGTTAASVVAAIKAGLPDFASSPIAFTMTTTTVQRSELVWVNASSTSPSLSPPAAPSTASVAAQVSTLAVLFSCISTLLL